MRALSFFVVVALCATGCSHAVRYEVPGHSDAEVSVDGVAVGKSPVTYKESIGTKGSTYEVQAELPSGQVVRDEVERSEASFGAIALGSGAGVAACCGLGFVSFIAALASNGGGSVASLVSFGSGCVGCLALPAGPLVGWLAFGQSPDSVVLDVNEAPAPTTPPPPALTPTPTPTPPPPTPPPAPLSGSAPPAPTSS